jgi:hypothetical protein
MAQVVKYDVNVRVVVAAVMVEQVRDWEVVLWNYL